MNEINEFLKFAKIMLYKIRQLGFVIWNIHFIKTRCCIKNCTSLFVWPVFIHLKVDEKETLFKSSYIEINDIM